MKREVPPQIVRLVFVLGVIAALAAVYEFAQGARPVAMVLVLAAVGALGFSSRFKQHL